MKKTLSLLLAITTLLPSLAGCNQTDPVETTVGTTTAEEVTAPTPANPLDSIFGAPSQALANTIVKDYWNRDTAKGNLDGNNLTYVWGYGSFMEAMAEAYRLFPEDQTIKQAYISCLGTGISKYKVTNATITTPNGQTHTVSYYNASRGNAGDYYYDDDAWVCIQFLNAYELLQDERYLKEAEEILHFLWTGWDDQLGGGIYWDKTYQTKNTCANGPIAIAFLWAHQLTGKADYLEKGKMIYEWVREVLMDQNDGLYKDAINLEGGIDKWKASYNQGTMIYAGSLLYEITGDTTYLKQTRTSYKSSIKLMFSGSGNYASVNNSPLFNAWSFAWLVRGYIKFYTIDPNQNTDALKCMYGVLKKNLDTQNDMGYYDPSFQSTNDWETSPTTDIIQACGMSSIMSLMTYYETSLKNAK